MRLSSATLSSSLAPACLFALGSMGGCSPPAASTAPLAPLAPSVTPVASGLPDPAAGVSFVGLQRQDDWQSLPRNYIRRGRRITAREGEHLIGPDIGWESFFEVPASHGGGFLLARDVSDEARGTYRTSTFTGPVTPTTDLVARSVSFGAGLMVVRDERGSRRILPSPTGTVKPLSLPLGVQDMVGSADGTRGLLLLHGGAIFATTDSGATYKDVTSRIGGTAGRLVTSDGDPAVALARGSAVFRPTGDFVASSTSYPPRMAPEPPEPEEKLDEGSHETAALQGVLVEPNVALVYHGTRSSHELRWVDLTTNKVLRRHKILENVPASDCVVHGLSNDVLLLCWGPRSGRLVYQVKTGGVLAREQAFAPALPFYGDHRGLVFPWKCGDPQGEPRDESQRHTACVRKGPGEWVTVDVGPHLGKERVVVMRWIPTRASAVAVVRSPAIGDNQRVWLVDPDGKKTEVDSTLDYAKHTYSNLLSLDFSVATDGTLRGWPLFRKSHPAAKEDTPPAEASDLSFSALSTSGRFALARRGRQHFVSQDWGTTFLPTEEPFRDLPRCGNLGCSDGTLLRVGWAPRPSADGQSPPANDRATPRDPAPAAPRSSAPLPIFRCKKEGPPAVKIQKEPPSNWAVSGPDQIARTTGLGARLLVAGILRDVNAGHGDMIMETYVQGLWSWREWHPYLDRYSGNIELAAMAHHRAHHEMTDDESPTETIGLAWVHPFDPRLTISETKLPLKNLLKALRTGGEGRAALSSLGNEDRAPMPVLGNKGRGYGLLLQNGAAPIWLPPANEKVEAIALGRALEGHAIVSASALGGPLTLLLEHHGATLAVEVHKGTVTEKLRIQSSDVPEHYPANPDALAHAPDGSLAVLRLPPYDSPPDAADPALVLNQGSPPTPLAPWSTLTPFSDPLCRNVKGHRAIVHTTAPWVRVTVDGTPVHDIRQILADVIWSPQRVCLMAARLGVSDSTSMVALYSAARPQHALNTVSSGKEERQALTCALTLE